MSLHAKRNYRPRARVVGTVTGIALLLGGGFAAQAVADSGVKVTDATPTVTTTGDATPQVASTPGVSTPGGGSKVVSPGTSADASKVVSAGTPASAGKSGVVTAPAAAPAAAPAEGAPRVIQPGSGVQK
ncbi:hypothetical protein [Kitasatospora sp. GAS1066B]|uniref:hypothetical protein n=1 Tax=Kitasatospora sp. GAS1066B TaxID=3156271 RepID=UPI003517FE74